MRGSDLSWKACSASWKNLVLESGLGGDVVGMVSIHRRDDVYSSLFSLYLGRSVG